MADFFIRNIFVVYFFYGLSFFSMGLAVFLEVARSKENEFAQALRPLSWFGLVHGSHEWFEMILLVQGPQAGSFWEIMIPLLRMAMLSGSFVLLAVFGVRLITGQTRSRQSYYLIGMLLVVWLVGLGILFVYSESAGFNVTAADVFTRYSLAIPGAVLTGWGLIKQRQNFIKQGMHDFGQDVLLAAFAFLTYGLVGQLFTAPSGLFPSTYLNSETFLRWFNFPVQVLRALCATFAAIFIIRSTRSFEVDKARLVREMEAAQLAERQRMQELRAELLHRTVQAQESERQRIALELHDGLGQLLTALGMGLRAIVESTRANPLRASQQAQHLEGLVADGVDELRRIVSGLHPPQLDDLGLLAALRWYAGEVTKLYQLPIQVSSNGQPSELSPEVRTVIFRIAQEAVTNIVRHSRATHATIHIESDHSQLRLLIEDNGRGFDVKRVLEPNPDQPSWGLMGMMERANLVGGTCVIRSIPSIGTTVEFLLPISSGEPNESHPLIVG